MTKHLPTKCPEKGYILNQTTSDLFKSTKAGLLRCKITVGLRILNRDFDNCIGAKNSTLLLNCNKIITIKQFYVLTLFLYECRTNFSATLHWRLKNNYDKGIIDSILETISQKYIKYCTNAKE